MRAPAASVDQADVRRFRISRFIPELLTRSTGEPSRRVIQLDFIRGVAILAVMAYHYMATPATNPIARHFGHFWTQVGFIGVDLFFVLSGFLVGGLLVQELLKTGNIRIRHFLLRRMLRIWPAYYVYILFQVLLHRHPLSSFFWQNLFNIQNYAGTSLKQTWSLAVEEHFYLVLPLLLYLLYSTLSLRKHIIGILLSICFGVLCIRTLSVYRFHSGDTQWQTHYRIDSLLFGVFLSYIFYSRPAIFQKILTLRISLAVAGMAGIIFAFYNGHFTRAMWAFGYSLNFLSMAALLLLAYGYHGRAVTSSLYRAIAAIGVYSYGIYLWHLSVREPLARLVAHLPLSTRWASLLFLQVVAAIVLGVLMTKAVEFPMLRLRDRLFPRGSARMVPEQMVSDAPAGS